jgi:hypothetical protein
MQKMRLLQRLCEDLFGVLVATTDGGLRKSQMRTLVQGSVVLLGCFFTLGAQTDRVPSGTEIVVRTNEVIDARHPSNSRIYSGVIDRDVTDRSGKVIIAKGANAELISRNASDCWKIASAAKAFSKMFCPNPLATETPVANI